MLRFVGLGCAVAWANGVKIDQKEQAYASVVFKNCDENEDETLDVDEFITCRTSLRTDLKPKDRKLFKQLDVDEDGGLTWAELKAGGNVPPDENSQAGYEYLSKVCDEDRDEKLSAEEYANFLYGMNGAITNYITGSEFERADANKDGSMSEKEFKKAFPNKERSDFTQSDANGNGVLDQGEAHHFLGSGMTFSLKLWKDIMKFCDVDANDRLELNEFVKYAPRLKGKPAMDEIVDLAEFFPAELKPLFQELKAAKMAEKDDESKGDEL